MIKKIYNEQGVFPPGSPFLFDLILKLKNLYRQGWIKSGIDQSICESVAEHSLSVAMLCMFYLPQYPFELNREKVIMTALIHDLAEAEAGDFTPSDSVSHEDKFQLECQVFETITQENEIYREWYELWLAFEKGGTPEGRFVRKMDKLEMLMQAVYYNKVSTHDLSDFFKSTESFLKEDAFFGNLFDELKSIIV